MILVTVDIDTTFLRNSDALYLVDSYKVSEEPAARNVCNYLPNYSVSYLKRS
jgi:hypothetical protein